MSGNVFQRQFFRLFVTISLIFYYTHFTFGQTENEKRSVNYENLYLEKILDSLSKKFEVNFSYNSDIPEFHKTKTISMFGSLEVILKELLKDENLDFSIMEKYVIIFPVKPSIDIPELPVDSSYLLKGKVVNLINKTPLPFSSITFKGRNLSTIANDNGRFIFRVPLNYINDTVLINCIGYKTYKYIIDTSLNEEYEFGLREDIIQLKPVFIKNIDALQIVKEIEENIHSNYDNKFSMYTGFYRETTKEDNEFISVCEAIVNISKGPYDRRYSVDQAKLVKGRKFENTRKVKTLNYKLEGGISNCLQLDIVKDLATFLSSEYFDSYNYRLEKTISYQERLLKVIKFEPKDYIAYPLYEGTLYVDDSSKALVAAKFGFSSKSLKYARDMIVKKTPRKFKINPVEVEYLVNYRRINGKYYLDNIRGTLKIKAKSEKFFFNSIYTSVIELAITDIDTLNHFRFKWNEVIKSKDIIMEKQMNPDPEFWGSYNIIKPDEPISDAILRLKMPKDIYNKDSFWRKIF